MSAACPSCGAPVVPSAIVVDLDRNVIVLGWVDATIALPPLEAEFAHLLVRASPRVVRHDYIIERLWGAAEPGDARNNVKVHVNRLRKKLGHLGVTIENVKERGYRLVIDHGAADAA